MVVLDLYLARHGQSYGNLPINGVEPAHLVPLTERPPGLETGRMEDDWHLTPLGQKQAELLGERLSATQFDAIYCSPLERAHATAKAIAIRQAQPAGLKVSREFLEVYDCGGETPAEWHARGLRAARALRGNHPPGARVLAVAHGGFNTFLLNALLGLPGPEYPFRFRHNNTGLTRIVFHSDDVPQWERVRLCYLNSLHHLSPEVYEETYEKGNF